jgi:hypothetical protein
MGDVNKFFNISTEENTNNRPLFQVNEVSEKLQNEWVLVPETRLDTKIEYNAAIWFIEKCKVSVRKLMDWEYRTTVKIFKKQSDNVYGSKASMNIPDYRNKVLNTLKEDWYVNNNSTEWELLSKLLHGTVTKKWNIVNPVLTEEHIIITIKSYYRKQWLKSFEKLTRLLNIDATFSRAYKSDLGNAEVYKKLWAIAKSNNRHENILLNLTFEERLYLYLLKPHNLWGKTFNLCYKLLLEICNTNEARFWVELIKFQDVIQANIDQQLLTLKN